ncbi:DUF6230 family protein [Streptomyces sp. NPDC051172]|uniref:DUF6230 family protein n=1 Tax=Streptomyces sp. NPDC051172 TaxID=3155796 RepID=UPI00342A8985
MTERTSKLRFTLAPAPLSIAGTALPAGSAQGAVSVAFAGQVLVTVHAARVSGSGLTASPAGSGRGGLLPALATRPGHARVEDACATPTAQLPLVGAATAVVRIDRASATGLTVEPGKVTARPVSLTRPTGLFSIGARKVSGREVRTEPTDFTAGTITAGGVTIDLHQGEGGCAREEHR